MVKLNDKKYKAAFMYLLNELEKIQGKKKACKLLYFLDFDFFEAYDKSFTGETYYKYNLGPFTKYFEDSIKELEKEGYVETEKIRMSPAHNNDTNIYKAKKKLAYKFDDNEKRMLKRIARIYGVQSGKELEDLSHTEAPWQAVEMCQSIPYEFAYYREKQNLKE